jgi:RNA polymerase sigma-70 factor (ECF subfamily)
MIESAGGDRELAAALEAMHQTGCASWSTVELSVDEFARHLASCAGEPLTVSWLCGRPATDLYLACACAHGVHTALAAFDEHYLSHVRAFLSHMRPDAEFVDECRQLLREKLFVGAAPKIAEYTGRGSLLGWLRVATVRTALNLRRSRALIAGARRAPSPVEAESIDEPERSYLQDRYRDAFRAAIEESFAVLSSEQRNLLRMHFMDGMTLHQLATLFQVHRGALDRADPTERARRDAHPSPAAARARHRRARQHDAITRQPARAQHRASACTGGRFPRRHAAGDSPVARRKNVMKFDSVENPTRSPIAAIL